MSCNTLESILKSCYSNLGGIVKFWINNGDAIDPSSITVTDGTVTAANLEITSSEFVEFQFNPNTSNYTENAVIDLVNGSTYYDQSINLVLNRREADKREKLLLIALGQPGLTIIVKDSNKLYWIFGLYDDKMYLTGNEGGSGTARADRNGYSLIFTGQDQTPAFQIEESVVESLTTPSS